jgi:hypothetical protein
LASVSAWAAASASASAAAWESGPASVEAWAAASVPAWGVASVPASGVALARASVWEPASEPRAVSARVSASERPLEVALGSARLRAVRAVRAQPVSESE